VLPPPPTTTSLYSLKNWDLDIVFLFYLFVVLTKKIIIMQK